VEAMPSQFLDTIMHSTRDHRFDIGIHMYKNQVREIVYEPFEAASAIFYLYEKNVLC